MPRTRTPARKFNLRLPDALRDALADLAEADGRSLNQLCVRILSQFVIDQRVSGPSKLSRKVVLPPRAEVSSWDVVAAPASELSAPSAPAPASSAPPAPLAAEVPVRPASIALPQIGANDPCPCGSGQRYAACHGR